MSDALSDPFGTRAPLTVDGQQYMVYRLDRLAEHGTGVGAGLQHGQIGFAQHQQCAVRLHRPREMDELALAIAEVRLTEGRAGRH